jgi:hypothetical protein
MAHKTKPWRAYAGTFAVALALVLAGCTSDQSVDKTPIGSVVTGKTDNPGDYLDSVQQANEDRQAGGQSTAAAGPGSSRY